MGENPKAISDKIIQEIDSLTLSPEERARKVWEKVAGLNIDYWSLAWFSVTYLTGLCSTLPYLKKPALEMGQLMYNHHYHYPEQLNLFDEKFGGKVKEENHGIQQEQESD